MALQLHIAGSVIRWGQQCRFRHMTTRHYLCVDASMNVTLTLDHRDPNAVFRLHPVVKVNNIIVLIIFQVTIT